MFLTLRGESVFPICPITYLGQMRRSRHGFLVLRKFTNCDYIGSKQWASRCLFRWFLSGPKPSRPPSKMARCTRHHQNRTFCLVCKRQDWTDSVARLHRFFTSTLWYWFITTGFCPFGTMRNLKRLEFAMSLPTFTWHDSSFTSLAHLKLKVFGPRLCSSKDRSHQTWPITFPSRRTRFSKQDGRVQNLMKQSRRRKRASNRWRRL